jgi:hypothetical protein
MATESDNVNSGALGTLLAVGLFSVIGIAFVVTALVRSEMADEAEKKEVSADRPYRDLVAEQGAKMNAPATYVDRGRGLVSLPIDRAMEVVVEGLKKDPNSATPPAPAAAGSGGMGGSGGASAEAGGTGGGGGTGGMAEGEAKPADEAIHAEEGDKAKPAGDKPEGDKGASDKGDKPDKKKEPKKAPVPVPPTLAPGPATPVSPAPNGQ